MMQVHDLKQGSSEWLAARCGLATASQFSTVLAKGQGKTRKTYLYKLAGERLTGKPADSFSNAHTERGHEMEPQARQFYAFMEDVEPQLVGFVTNYGAGASPDSFVGGDGLLEIKTKLPHLLLEAHERGSFPPEHYAQCQGQLWITDRQWCDLICYWPGMRPLIVRTHRDDKYLAALSEEIARFNDELQQLVAKYSIEERMAA